ncbi:SH3 domain-containing protein [Streptomyces sp. bgisy154]|uniref:SH3 domain-containing protein n=1 Tax=Streptomyces sp. bgisy154 TaxID=3413794 RepID=UPI003D7084DB
MSLRSTLSRVSGVVIGATLASALAVAPAAAGEEWGGDGRGGDGRGGDGRGDWGHHQEQNSRLAKGVVTANGGLLLRSAPTRAGQVIRVAAKGEIVSIYCKTGGETVGGNPLWYLLTDGTWAWGAARYIDNIGPAPRWC